MQYLLQLRVGKLHSMVMDMVDELIEDGMDYKKAIKITVRKYRHLFENFLDEIADWRRMKRKRGGGELIYIRRENIDFSSFHFTLLTRPDGFVGKISAEDILRSI